MRWTPPFHLHIRQKVIIGLTVSMLTIGLIGAVSYRYLHQIERKQELVEIADDLSNIILEMRRYEKNYLLYGSSEDLQENQQYIRQGKETLTKLTPEIRDLQGGPLLKLIEKELLAYNQLMEKMATADSMNTPGGQELEEHVRESGKNLVDLSHQLVSFERRRILKIVQTLKTQLLSSIVIFGILGAFLIPFVGQKIIRPLRVIERTTHRIAQGNFTPLPVQDTRDETQRVVEAFNRMVAELERRQEQLLQAKKLSSLGILTSGSDSLPNISMVRLGTATKSLRMARLMASSGRLNEPEP